MFGCHCYILIPSTNIIKSQYISTPFVFLDYSFNHRGYKCYQLSSHKINIFGMSFLNKILFPFSNFNSPTMTNYNLLDDGIILLLPSHMYIVLTPHIPTPSTTSYHNTKLNSQNIEQQTLPSQTNHSPTT